MSASEPSRPVAWQDTPTLDACGSRLRDLVTSLLDDQKIRAHSIEYRVKTHESIERKIAQKNDPGYTRAKITDLLGIRIITHFQDEVDLVATIIETEFDIDPRNSVDKRANLDPERFGYISLHYVARLNAARRQLIEYKRFDAVRFEIQIRSILQHAWAEIEHDLGYKSKSSIPTLERRRFSRLAGLLELADAEFTAIRSSLEVHAVDVEEAMKEQRLDVPIDRDSLNAYMRLSPLVSDIEATALNSSDETRPARSLSNLQVARAIALLASVGVDDLDNLNALLRRKRDLVRRFTAEMLGGEDLANVRQGTSVYYLALLEASSLPSERADEAFVSAGFPRAMRANVLAARSRLGEG